MRVAGVLFDKDGTLVDFDATWGEAAHPVMHQLSAGDAAAMERLARVMHYEVAGRRFRPTSPFIGGSLPEIAGAWARVLGRTNAAALLAELNDLFAAETLRALMPIGDPLAVMQALRAQGRRLGLATNDTEASGLAQLEALGLDVHMDFVAGYDSGHGGKPGPGMVLAFAAALAVEPDRVALVGDTLHDLHAARAAGAVAIAVLSGPVGRDVLAPHADHVIGSIAALPDLLDALG